MIISITFVLWSDAQSDQQALNFVIKNEPALILLDIMMPEMDGYDVCKRLKSDLGSRHIPIIFITAKTDTEDVVKGFEVGGGGLCDQAL